MANEEHVAILGKEIGPWNRWREQRTGVRPDLSEASLREANLVEADLNRTDLYRADLTGAHLIGAVLMARGGITAPIPCVRNQSRIGCA
jgi:hypothetical protein